MVLVENVTLDELKRKRNLMRLFQLCLADLMKVCCLVVQTEYCRKMFVVVHAILSEMCPYLVSRDVVALAKIAVVMSVGHFHENLYRSMSEFLSFEVTLLLLDDDDDDDDDVFSSVHVNHTYDLVVD